MKKILNTKFFLDISDEFIPKIIIPFGVFFVILVVWVLLVYFLRVPVYIVPSPLNIVDRLFEDIVFFIVQSSITLFVAIAGFVIGAFVAVFLAILIVLYKTIGRIVFPISIFLKVTPIIAIAPLLTIWFGFGVFVPLFIVALMTFFPILVNTHFGLYNVNHSSIRFFQSIGASKLEVMKYLRVRSALASFFTSVRICIPLALIGAVVAQFFGSGSGLGWVILVSYNNLDMTTCFAAVLSLSFIGTVLTISISFIENKIIFWRYQ